VSAKGFIAQLRDRCMAAPGRIGFPDADDIRMLRVADRLLAEGSFEEVTLFTSRAASEAMASQYAIDLQRHGKRLVYEERGERAERLGHAADLLASGRLHAVLAGNIATTAEVIRAGIGGVGLAQGVRTVSGAFVMNKPDGPIHLFADCGVVITPSVRQLADIATESVKTWGRLFPKIPAAVAFLSFSTKGSAQHEAQAKMAEACALFKAQHPAVLADGEMQFDAAIDPEIAKRKAPDSPVAGRANCFIFPDLDAGNISYKIAQRLGGYEAYGPILQGLAKSFSDLSRGATEADIIASAYINLLRSRA
jgi:phosphate acetyltransferase